MKYLRPLFLFATMFCIMQLNSQVVYVTEWKSEATLKVYVSDSPADADIIVYKSEWKSEAEPESGIWYFTEWKTEADQLIYFTEWRSEADVVICYTNYKSEAGKRK
jgi:hypothetical protein